jgi:hypothetical protein
MATTMQGKFEGLVRTPFGIAWEPDASLYRAYAVDSSWNIAHVNDPKLTAMLKEERRTKDLEARRRLIHDITVCGGAAAHRLHDLEYGHGLLGAVCQEL